MRFDDIYRVESVSLKDTDKVNALLENGWKLLDIASVDFKYDAHDYAVGASRLYILGATKPIFEEFNLEKYKRTTRIVRSANNLALKLTNANNYKMREKSFFSGNEDDLPF